MPKAEKKSHGNELFVFDFRLGVSHYNFTPLTLCDLLSKIFKKFVFQKEQGAGGYLHWQGRGSLWKKKRVEPAKHLFNKIFNNFTIGNYNFAPTSEDTAMKKNFDYVMKEDTRVEGPWSDKNKPVYIPRQYRVELFPWQQMIIDSAEEWDPRSINLIIDPEGNHGKSVITGVARCKGFYAFPTSLDSNRLQESVCDILMAKQDRTPKLIFFDIPRSQNKKALSQLFATIEVVKSGIVCDTRYSFKEWMFDSPTVWVMTNEELDLKLLSRDRWKIWRFEDKDLLQVLQ